MTPATPVRLALCIDNLGIGGTELNLVRWAEWLDPSRFALTIVHFTEHGPLRERLEATGARLKYIPLHSLWKPSMLRAGRELARFVSSERIEILHTQDIYSNIFAVPWARLGGAGAVVASRRWWHLSPARAHRVANRTAYRFAHRVVANSPSVGTLLREQERVPASKVVCIPNFLDDSAFVSPEPAVLARMREELGVPAGATVIGIVARLDAVKDHTTLFDAFERVAATRPELHLLCCGEGPERSRLEQKAATLAAAERIHLPGSVVPGFNPHWLFDYSVLSSKTEGFPNSVIEAMAASRPLVATDVGGVPDALTDGETGLLVPAGDAESMARALARLLDEPSTAAALSERGCAHARATFAARPVVERLSSFYEGLAGRT